MFNLWAYSDIEGLFDFANIQFLIDFNHFLTYVDAC